MLNAIKKKTPQISYIYEARGVREEELFAKTFI